MLLLLETLVAATMLAHPAAPNVPARPAVSPLSSHPAAPAPAHPVAAPSCNDSLSARLKDRLNPVLAARAKAGTFSGVVLVACNGNTLYASAVGMANRSKQVKVDLDTRFNLGSMNKMWTAVAVAQLVEQGKIDLDAPVGRYLPDIPNQQIREQVLVRHLLSHTSGLGSYFKRGYLRDRVALTKASDLLRFFVDDSLSFAPGSRFEYSNAGYAVLGAIIERVSGISYYDYMKKNVIDRAGMNGASFVTLPLAGDKFAVGYATPPGTDQTSENTDMIERTSSPAGGAFATAADLVAFSRALWSGKLVGLPLVKKFTTGITPMGGIKYAYGFGDGLANGIRTVGHNGGGPGIGTDFMSLPDLGIDIVVLTNIEVPAASEVLGEALSVITGAPPPRFITPPGGAPPPGGERGQPVMISPPGGAMPGGAMPGGAMPGGAMPGGAMPNDGTRQLIMRPPPAGGANTGGAPMPTTVVGQRTAAFLAAFSAGGSAMTTFIDEQMVPTDKPAAERAKGSADMRDQIGRLTFTRVLSEKGNQLIILVDSEKSGSLKITTEVEAAAPHRLLARIDFNPYP